MNTALSSRRAKPLHLNGAPHRRLHTVPPVAIRASAKPCDPEPVLEPEPELVRAHLRCILASRGFARASRMKKFLEFVVEESLAGRAGQICEYSIALSVFGRGSSFEPGLDPIVRNDARRLRQKLDEFYRENPPMQGEALILEIPKGGYAPAFRSAVPAPEVPRFRLSVMLIRIADGMQVWSADQEITLVE